MQPTIERARCVGLAAAALVAVLVALAPGALSAQTPVPEDDQSTSEASAEHDDVSAQNDEHQAFDETHRHKLYRKGKLDYGTAALRTALFPALGNFYARQYFIGGINATLMAFTAVLIPYGVATFQPAFTWAGVGVAGAAYTSGFITSAIGVRRYNQQLKRRLRLGTRDPATSPFAIPKAPTFTITIPF
ncbi:MAG: hypothetical protein ABEN55_23775 [Bradymonadaceae bacterium]